MYVFETWMVINTSVTLNSHIYSNLQIENKKNTCVNVHVCVLCLSLLNV